MHIETHPSLGYFHQGSEGKFFFSLNDTKPLKALLSFWNGFIHTTVLPKKSSLIKLLDFYFLWRYQFLFQDFCPSLTFFYKAHVCSEVDYHGRKCLTYMSKLSPMNFPVQPIKSPRKAIKRNSPTQLFRNLKLHDFYFADTMHSLVLFKGHFRL